MTPVATVTHMPVLAHRDRRQTRAASMAGVVGLCLLAVLYPIHTEAVANINLSAGDAVIFMILLGVTWQFIRGPVLLPRYLPHIITVTVVIITSVVVNAFTPSTYFSLYDGSVETVKFLAVAVWMISVFALLTPDLPRRFTVFAVASSLVAALWSVVTVIENVVWGSQRPTGPFANPNIYANYLVLNAFLVMGAAKLLGNPNARATLSGLGWLQQRRSLLTVVILPTLILGMLSSGSRGGLVSFAAGLLVCPRLWFPRRITFRVVMTAIVGFALLGGGISWFLKHHPYVLTRVERTGRGEDNVAERFRLWKAAQTAFTHRPVIGIGYGEFSRYANHAHNLPPKVAHQMYLSVAAELGIVGFAAFMWLLLAPLWDSMRIRSPVRGAIAQCCTGALAAACVHGFFANVEQFRTLWIAIGIVAALLAVREPVSIPRVARWAARPLQGRRRGGADGSPVSLP